MEFAVLGGLEVRSPTGGVTIRRGLPRTLLIALLLRPGQTVSSDVLVEVLWGDNQPRNPANSLQIQVSYLRKTLGSADPEAASLLATRAGGYALTIDPECVDAHRFEALTRRFPALAGLRSTAALRSALDETTAGLDLWRGPALEEVADAEFARGDITRLEELRWSTIERRIDLLLRLGEHVTAASDLSELVQLMPLRERLHEQRVLALYRSGRQADALRAYEEARKTLAEELGLDPGENLRRLESAVLRQDPALDWGEPDEPDASPTETRDPVTVPRPARLPVPLSGLIGRDTELTRLTDLLGKHRAVTLTGPAGAGKTRLAIELATRRAGAVWYVDLSPIDDPALVAPTCAAGAGVAVAPGDDPLRALADTLASREGLLVLDTCEHLLAGASHVASTVLRSAPDIRVVATSRRALGLSGEIAWPVPPLELPPADTTDAAEITNHAAVRLFVERAQAVRADLAIDDQAAADIAAICVALDGLPLAIELAAARCDVLSPGAIRTRLSDRFDLLVDGDADAAERQQTLRAAIDWSFALLSDDQRHLFARLGVFVGTFDLDAALTVAGAGLAAPLELLASLVKQSMVSRAGQERYRLLDTLRAYALDVLAELDADDTRDRHAEYFAALAERGEVAIRGPEQLDWLDHLRSDTNNFRAALEWSLHTGDTERAAREAGALAWFWTLNGMLTEAIEHLERLLRSENIPAATRARCEWGYALLAASLGRLETARLSGYRAAELGRDAHDVAATGYGLNAAAVAEWALGHHDHSLRAHAEAIELLAKIEDQWGLAICKVLQARTLFDQRDAGAGRVAREGVEHARLAGDLHVLGIALTQIAQMSIADGDPRAAVAAATEALGLQEQIGYTEGSVSALHVLGHAHRLAGDLEAARGLHRRAVSLASTIGHAAAMCEALEDLARVEAAEQPALARRLLRAARAERQSRSLPLRERDAEELAALEDALPTTGDDPTADLPFASLVADLTT
ncbi:MAG TPA: BTAD domain-containing putative transcriptional regulator [Acidimicrobiales bacterium]